MPRVVTMGAIFLSFAILPAFSAAAKDGVPLVAQQSADGEIEGWESFHEETGTKTGDVWNLDSDGVLVCKGLPRGYLYTKKNYTDVTMSFEWRWPPQGKAGNGGLLLRTTGDNKIWPKSLEVQLNHGAAGDYWGLCGYGLKGPAERMKTIEHDVFGLLTNVKHSESLEKPVGEWNRCDVVLKGDAIQVKINGQVVNRAEDCDVEPGKILLTAEGAEIHFRNIRLVEGT